jgi:hypothetical protein
MVMPARAGVGFWAADRSAIVDGDRLYIKEPGASAIFGIDLAGPARLWRKPFVASAMIVGADAERFYLMSESLDSVSREAPFLLQHSRTILSDGPMIPLVLRGEAIVFASRGVYRLDLATLDTRQLLRGGDIGSGGAVLLAGDTLVTVSRQRVTGYRVKPVGGKP